MPARGVVVEELGVANVPPHDRDRAVPSLLHDGALALAALGGPFLVRFGPPDGHLGPVVLRPRSKARVSLNRRRPSQSRVQRQTRRGVGLFERRR
jgi:hypothetical protein